jgi:hypothetical protein
MQFSETIFLDSVIFPEKATVTNRRWRKSDKWLLIFFFIEKEGYT